MDSDQLRLFARDRELPAATAVLTRSLHKLFLQSNDAKFSQVLESISQIAATVLGADGVANRVSLAGAMYELSHPLPRRSALLADGHVRAALAATPVQHSTGEVDFELKLAIDVGWHINTHAPVQDYLIPVNLAAAAGQELSVTYPAGKLVRLGFEESPLSVYEGSVTFVGRIGPRPAVALTSAPLKLTLQACTDKVCLPPKSVQLHFRLP